MTYDQFNAFCGALPATTHVVQWSGSHVWKIGGKVFAVGGRDDGGVGFCFGSRSAPRGRVLTNRRGCPVRPNDR